MKLVIPEAALTQHIIALGKTGSGKSSKLRVLVEHELDRGVPICILDPKGDWWGLKSSADGTRAGYPVVIFGGEHADVPLNPRAGGAVAELIFTGNRPCVIDMRAWTQGERTRFFIDFAPVVFRITRGKRILLLAEAHNFAPKGKILSPEAGEMLHWANRLASESRGLGLTIFADSQRPQKVHNDFLTSAETLIACRVVHKSDRVAIEDWIDGCADPELGKQVVRELASMKRHEAWVWSPEIEFGPKRIAFSLFKTYDSFKPQAARTEKLRGWASVDLDEVKQKLASVVAEAEANDPAKLKRRVAELEKQVLARSSAKGENKASREDVVAAESRGLDKGFRQGTRCVQVVLRNVEREIIAAIRQPLTNAQSQLAGARPENPNAVAARTARTASESRPRKPEAAVAVTRARQINGPVPTEADDATLPKGEMAVLGACIQHPDGLRREQLTVLSGYKRSTRDAYIQRLREREYLETRGDLVFATDAGHHALPDFEPLPTGQELQRYWLERLPEGERAILSVLIEAHPEDLSRVDLDETTGFKRSTRDAYLSRLAAKNLVIEPVRGRVRASPNLF